MPGWLQFIAYIVGSGGAAGVVIAIMNHKLQQRRDREQEARAAQRAWVARRRQLCIDLLDAVNGFHSLLSTFRSLHDNLESRLAVKEMLEAPRQQMQPLHDTVLHFRSELDLEPNDKLQAAVDHWGDASVAYQEALARPMSSRWNPVRLYFGKSPQDEINRLADDVNARREELRDAVRAYMASLEAPVKPERVPTFPKVPISLKQLALPWPHFHRQDATNVQDRTVVGVTAETPAQHSEQENAGQDGMTAHQP